MAIDFGAAYEAPISLDAERLIGTRSRRSTLWTLAAGAVLVPIIAAFVAVQLPAVQALFLPWVIGAVTASLPLGALWLLLCYVLGADWGQRRAEYWLRAWLRHRRLPRRWGEPELRAHHADLHVDQHILVGADYPRGVVEIVGTVNLQMTDAETLAGHVRKLHAFFMGLRFPIQIVVRAWAGADAQVERRWFVAVTADSATVLDERLRDIQMSLHRAGLGGRPLNGDLFDSLQVCWTTHPAGTRLGPHGLVRERGHVVVDGEYVRGFVLSKFPRTIEPNWLAPLLDGDTPIDFAMWLDPIDNTDELAALSDRVNEWETAQVLNFTRSGYRDPDLDDQIKDASRTRLMLHRRMLRVFRGSIGFVVRGTTVVEMALRERVLGDHLRETVGDDAVIPLDYEQDHAPLLVVPTGTPPITYLLQMVSPAVAMSYPFSNSCVSMKDGVECGTSIGSKRVNRLNLFGLTNPHMIVPATSGAGKGYWLKVFLWRLLHQDDEVYVRIIQSEKDEYTALAEALGPQRAQVIRITRLDQLSAERRARPGVVRYETRWHQQNVIGMHETIEPLVDERGRLWAFRDLVVYDLTRMDAHERGTAVAFLLNAIEQSARYHRRRRGVVVIDELGIVLRDEAAGFAIETAYRRFRSIPWDNNPREVNRIAMIGLTQRPSDLLGTRWKVLADLSETHLYLRQKSTEIRGVAKSANLSPDEVAFLETCDDGDGLLVAGRARVGLHLFATPEEHEFART